MRFKNKEHRNQGLEKTEKQSWIQILEFGLSQAKTKYLIIDFDFSSTGVNFLKLFFVSYEKQPNFGNV